MNKLQIILICLLAMLGLGYGQTVDFSKESLIDLCTAYEKAINSIQIEYTYTAQQPDAELLEEWENRNLSELEGPVAKLFIAEKPFDEKFKFINEFRVKGLRSGLTDVYSSLARNAPICRELSIHDNDPPRGIIHKECPEEPALFINDTPLACTPFHRYQQFAGNSLLKLLKSNDPNLAFSFDPAVARVNDCDAVELICSMKWVSGRMIKMFGVHFSLDHNMSIVRISFYNHNKVDFEYNVLKLEPLGNGLWFPVECVIGIGESISKMSVSYVQVNQPYEKDEFELDFPPGTRVEDMITGKEYTIKPTQEQGDQGLGCR